MLRRSSYGAHPPGLDRCTSTRCDSTVSTGRSTKPVATEVEQLQRWRARRRRSPALRLGRPLPRPHRPLARAVRGRPGPRRPPRGHRRQPGADVGRPRLHLGQATLAHVRSMPSTTVTASAAAGCAGRESIAFLRSLEGRELQDRGGSEAGAAPWPASPGAAAGRAPQPHTEQRPRTSARIAATLYWLDEYYEAEVVPARVAPVATARRVAWRRHEGDRRASTTPAVAGPVPAEDADRHRRSISIVHLLARSHRRGAELVAMELAAELDKRGHHNRLVALGPGARRRPRGGARAAGRHRGRGSPRVSIAGSAAAAPPRRGARRRGPGARRLGGPDRGPDRADAGDRSSYGNASSAFLPRSGDLFGASGGGPSLHASTSGSRSPTTSSSSSVGSGSTSPCGSSRTRGSRSASSASTGAAAAARLRDELAMPLVQPLIGFVGHLVRQKRPERTLEVVARLREMDRPVAPRDRRRRAAPSRARGRGPSTAVSDDFVTFLGPPGRRRDGLREAWSSRS